MTTYCYEVTAPVHQRHLRFSMTDICKSISQLNPEFMWFYFTHKDMPYNLRKGPIIGLPKIHSFYYGTYAVHFHASNLDSILSKNSKSCLVSNLSNIFEKIGQILTST